jgi:hypothetical protein
MTAREREAGQGAPRPSAARTARTLAGLSLVVVAVLSTCPAAAQLLREGNPSAACPLLDESQGLDSGLGTQLDLAACYEHTGKLASAHRLFTLVADEAGGRGHGERALLARARASALEPRLSKLNIVVSASQRARVEVERDGAPMAAHELGVAVPVDPGVHTVRVSGQGLHAWAVEIRVAAEPGEHTVLVPLLLEKRLQPQLHSGIRSVPPHDEPRMKSFLGPTHRKVAVVAGATGLLGVSAGTIVAMRAISKLDESDRLGCIGSLCPTAAGVEARRQAQVSTNIATASMITGLTGLATAAALFLLLDGDDTDSARGSSHVEPRIARSSGELLWRGEF